MLDLYTALQNPDFGAVASAMGLWGRTVDKADEVEEAVRELFAQPGPGLLNVHVTPMALVKPPHVEMGPFVGMALYSARAVLHGRGDDVWHMVRDNYL